MRSKQGVFAALCAAFLSTSALAGTCNNKTLDGVYSIYVEGIESAATGRAVFSNGKISAVTITLVDVYTGETETNTGTGVYTVSTKCKG